MENKFLKVKTISPGKILICGGYLILNEKYKGISLAVNSKFYTESSIQKCRIETIKEITLSYIQKLDIKVYSENFKTEYSYTFDINITDINKETFEFKHCKVSYSNNSITNSNTLIESSLCSVICFLINNKYYSNNFKSSFKSIKSELSILINLKGDSSFYSDNIANVKTGLGSSSALISSLCTSFYFLFNENFIKKDNIEKIKIDSCYISLIANSIAANKIGSGFDILTCFKGSIVFQRINQVFNCKDFFEKAHTLTNEKIIELNSVLKLDELDEFNKYYEDIKTINVLNCLKIYLVVDDNSLSTDSRVASKNVIDYIMKNQGFENNETVLHINKQNEMIINLLLNYSQSNNKKYLKSLKESCLELRKEIRKLSELSNVEIEPKSRIELLNNLINYDNCVYSIIPGAGGYDGLCALFINENDKDGENEKNFIEKINKEFNCKFIELQMSSGIIVNLD